MRAENKRKQLQKLKELGLERRDEAHGGDGGGDAVPAPKLPSWSKLGKEEEYPEGFCCHKGAKYACFEFPKKKDGTEETELKFKDDEGR